MTRKHGPNALPITGKLRVAVAPEKDAIMTDCGKRTWGMHPSKLVNKADSSSEILFVNKNEYEREISSIAKRSPIAEFSS